MYSKEIEKILYWFEGDIIKLIDKVLSDNMEEPEYSAVTCNNKIVTLIKAKEDYKEKYKSVEEYLEDIGYCEEDIKKFIGNRTRENKEFGGLIEL